MSNRVCLFSTNFVPGTEVAERRVVGISEWGNDLPLGFKILMSATPRKCPSLIWDPPDSAAVIADYEPGVARFLEFLARIPHPTIPGLIDEARAFLTTDTNKNRYFLLEPEEYFWLGNDEPNVQMDHLLGELANLEQPMAKAIAEVESRMYEETHPPGFLARLFGARTPVRRENSSDLAFALALGGWSNTLFYQPE